MTPDAQVSDAGVFELTCELVDIASESFAEQALVDWLESELRSLPHLEVTRVGDNLVAQTELGRGQRLVLGRLEVGLRADGPRLLPAGQTHEIRTIDVQGVVSGEK